MIYTEYAQAQSFLTSKTASMSFAPNGLWKELENKGVSMQILWDAPAILDTNGMNIMPEAPNLDAVEGARRLLQPAEAAGRIRRDHQLRPADQRGVRRAVAPEQAEELPNAPGRKNKFYDNPIYNAEHQPETEKENERLFAEA